MSKRKYIAQDHSAIQEQRVATDYCGYTTTGSGNKDTKGDVRITRVMRIECKATTKKSFSITREMLDKLKYDCLGFDEIPCIQVDFISPRGEIIEQVAVTPINIIRTLIDVKTRQEPTE